VLDHDDANNSVQTAHTIGLFTCSEQAQRVPARQPSPANYAQSEHAFGQGPDTHDRLDAGRSPSTRPGGADHDLVPMEPIMSWIAADHEHDRK